MSKFTFYDLEYHELGPDGRRVVHTQNAGDVSIGDSQQVAYFSFECPKGKGVCSYMRIAGGPADDLKRPRWMWNKNWKSPSFTPSINCLAHNLQDPSEKYAGCGWHGYITNGVIK